MFLRSLTADKRTLQRAITGRTVLGHLLAHAHAPLRHSSLPAGASCDVIYNQEVLMLLACDRAAYRSHVLPSGAVAGNGATRVRGPDVSTSSPGSIVDCNDWLRLHRREIGSGGSGGCPRFAAQHCRHWGVSGSGDERASKDRAFGRDAGSDYSPLELDLSYLADHSTNHHEHPDSSWKHRTLGSGGAQKHSCLKRTTPSIAKNGSDAAY